MEKINPIDPDKIKRADILLVHTKHSFISWLIRKFTKSDWNHVGLFISKDDQWPKWVIEALNPGVVGRPFELKYVKVLRDDNGKIIQIDPSKKYRIAIVRVKDLSYEQCKKITTKAYHWALEEKGYDFLLLIVGIVLHLLTFRRWRPQWLNVKNKFICSELIAVVFKKVAGVDFAKHADTGYVTPADIYRSAETQKDIEIVMNNIS